jgi:hypothetical protein
VWATTTFQPEAPFRVMRADGSIAVFDTVHHLAEAIGQRKISIAHTFLVDAKIRPVVILQGRPRGALPEYAALKLTRLANNGCLAVALGLAGLDPKSLHATLPK